MSLEEDGQDSKGKSK